MSPVHHNSPAEETQQLGEELRQVISAFVREVRKATGTRRNSQHETLELLENSGPLSVAELARLRGVKHQSMRLVTAELEQQQLVVRQKNPADSRAQLIRLTDDAHRQLAAARALRSEWISRELHRKLDKASQEDLRHGLAALRKLLDTGLQPPEEQ
mgnify:FL=1